MSNPADIRPDHLEIVQDILSEHLPMEAKVWVFGSRANWTTKDSSDLDLAVEGAGRIDHKAMVRLEIAFEESALPYTVDVVDLNAVSKEFKEIVEGQKVPLPSVRFQTQANDAGWKRVTLGDVCTKVGSGATPRGGKDVYLHEGPFTLIRSQNVYNDGFHRDGLAFIGVGHANELQNVEVFEEDVLLNITGDSVARVCQVAPDVLPARVNQHVAIIRPDSDNLNAGFLRYCLASPKIQAMLLSWAGSGGTRNALTKGMIESLEISLPPLLEQRAIAHILGALDDKIELNRRMNQTLEAMARAIFQDWFVDFGPVRAKLEGREPYLPPELWKLFPDRLADSELGEMPEGWEVKALGEVIALAYGKALKADDRKGGDIPVYGSNGQVGWHDEKLVDGPGIVVGRKGNPGVVTWAHTDFYPIDTAFYVVPAADGLSLYFLLYVLTGQDLPSVAADSAVPGLNRNLAYMNSQIVPDPILVDTFGRHVAQIFERRHQLDEESRALATQRDVLLPKLVAGELHI